MALGTAAAAREARALAMNEVRQGGSKDIDRIVQECNDVLEDTRGGVMAIARNRGAGSIAPRPS